MVHFRYEIARMGWTVAELPMLLWWLTLITSIYYWLNPGSSGSSCSSMLSQGRWSHEPATDHKFATWVPNGCMSQVYQSSDIRNCLLDRPLAFLGDSIARQLYKGISTLVQSDNTSHVVAKHADLTLSSSAIPLSFIWDPFLNRSTALKGTAVISTGLWQARYLNESFVQYQQALQQFLLNQESHARIILLPVTTPIQDKLTEQRRKTLEPDLLLRMNDELRKIEDTKKVEIAWYTDSMTQGKPSLFASDGLHVTNMGISVQANVLLNHICNAVLQVRVHKPAFTCCTREEQNYNRKQRLVVVIVFWIGLLSFCGALFLFKHLSESRIVAGGIQTSSHASLKSLLTSVATLCAAICYCFVADRTQIFVRTNKVVDQTVFTILSCIILLAGSAMTKHFAAKQPSHHNTIVSPISILERSQSEEWKGWMQCIILLYHYFGMSRILWVYRIVRVLVGSYLFLTGYGHTRYFLITSDYSWSRVASTLMRLNLLSALLATLMDTPWDFYYFPMLASFWFLVIHATLLGASSRTHLIRIVLRIVLSATIVSIATKHGHMLEVLHDSIALIGGPRISTTEFRFRLNTDLYAPFAGMLFGAVQCIKGDSCLSNQPTDTVKRIQISRIVIGLAYSSILVGYFWYSAKFTTKQQYNTFHSYASPLPILAYIAIRNLTPASRAAHSATFAWVGRCSLETFILQYHVWLAGDTKGLLHLGIFDHPEEAHGVIMSWQSWRFWVEKALLTIIFIWLSDRVSTATNVIVSTLFKRGRAKWTRRAST